MPGLKLALHSSAHQTSSYTLEGKWGHPPKKSYYKISSPRKIHSAPLTHLEDKMLAIVLKNVFSYLSLKDISACNQTCRIIRKYIELHETDIGLHCWIHTHNCLNGMRKIIKPLNNVKKTNYEELVKVELPHKFRRNPALALRSSQESLAEVISYHLVISMKYTLLAIEPLDGSAVFRRTSIKIISTPKVQLSLVERKIALAFQEYAKWDAIQNRKPSPEDYRNTYKVIPFSIRELFGWFIGPYGGFEPLATTTAEEFDRKRRRRLSDGS